MNVARAVRMRVLLLAVPVLMVAPVALAAHYRGTTLAPDHATLVLHTGRGDVIAPRTAGDQRGFDDPRIASGGRTVGWLVLLAVPGTSSPVPMSLVLFRGGKVVREFNTGESVIYGWTFADGGNAVAYSTGSAHSPTGYAYELHRLSDGRLLGKFACGRRLVGTPPRAHAGPTWMHHGKVPAWVWPIAGDCPVRRENRVDPGPNGHVNDQLSLQ